MKIGGCSIRSGYSSKIMIESETLPITDGGPYKVFMT